MFVLLFSALCKVLSVLKLTLSGQIDVGKVDCRGADDVLFCLDELDARDFVKILFHFYFPFLLCGVCLCRLTVCVDGTRKGRERILTAADTVKICICGSG